MASSVLPAWEKAYRIVNSAFPPIAVFEDTLDPADLEVAFLIEGMTNDRLCDEAGQIQRVPPQDRVSGPGSTPIMAAFTHIGRASRFTDGTFGVYYCASSIAAAIAETRHHQEAFWRATAEATIEVTMRTYVNQVVKPMEDRRGDESLHHPEAIHYPITQALGRQLREAGAWGLLYRSVRAPGHECVAALRPPALSLTTQGPHLRYRWDGRAQAFSYVLEVREASEAVYRESRCSGDTQSPD
ncbi:RES family NAD+ phosphorylase [Pseudomonas silvicola]|nr:RES family NAD+ phosphorylase [Pseudomonas silvicola]